MEIFGKLIVFTDYYFLSSALAHNTAKCTSGVLRNKWIALNFAQDEYNCYSPELQVHNLYVILRIWSYFEKKERKKKKEYVCFFWYILVLMTLTKRFRNKKLLYTLQNRYILNDTHTHTHSHTHALTHARTHTHTHTHTITILNYRCPTGVNGVKCFAQMCNSYVSQIALYGVWTNNLSEPRPLTTRLHRICIYQYDIPDYIQVQCKNKSVHYSNFIRP